MPDAGCMMPDVEGGSLMKKPGLEAYPVGQNQDYTHPFKVVEC